MNETAKDNFLQRIDGIHQEYDKKPTVELLSHIQKEQINLIKDILKVLIEEKKSEENYVWEKAALIGAMNLIKINICRNVPTRNHTTFIRQKLPLVKIEQALIPANERSDRQEHLSKYNEFTLEKILSDCSSIQQLIRANASKF